MSGSDDRTPLLFWTLFVYALGVSLVTFYFVVRNLPAVFSEGVEETTLITASVTGGVLLGTIRVIMELANDKAKNRFKPNYALTFFVRPLEAAVASVIVYGLLRGGMTLFNFQISAASGIGVVGATAFAGGFAHITLDRLRKRMLGKD